jgi:hypothetical protein
MVADDKLGFAFDDAGAGLQHIAAIGDPADRR